MGSWERGRSWVCEWRERKLVLGALKWGGHRSGGGLGLLVWWPRAEGRAPLEGGKGNRPRGGCRETQEAPAPPPNTSSTGSSRKLGWQGLGATADMRRGGPGAQREGHRKPSHQGECSSVCMLWERGGKDKEMVAGEAGGEGGELLQKP